MEGQHIRQIRRLVTATLAFLLAMGCCGWAAAEVSETSLWVVTEYTGPGQMDTILEEAIAAFREKRPDVLVNLEILSPQQEIRQSQLAALREAMEAGKGPDVYVLSAVHALSLGPKGRSVEPLFDSIPYAMRQGVFRDISDLYSRDASLDALGLQATVMDGGCVGSKRLLLPLSFDVKAFYFLFDGEIPQLQPDMTVLDVLDYGLSKEDSELALALTRGAMTHLRPEAVFSSLINYDTGKVSLSFEEVAEFLTRYEKLYSMAQRKEGYVLLLPNLEMYLSRFRYGHPGLEYLPCYLSSIGRILSLPAMASLDEKELAVIPLRAVSGDVTAMVKWFGAVGADSSNPELAYELLSSLLRPEYQWRSQVDALPLGGWPVLVEGSAEAMWSGLCSQILSQRERALLENVPITEEWVTRVTDEITRVDFQVDVNFTEALDLLMPDA